jgi:uncharacterized protein
MPDVVITGPEGRLEGRYHHSKDTNAPIALLLHPHPEHGGTMNNKIVYQLYHTFARRGFSTLRFNFRGVGRSQGVYDRGEGELSDAASALDWLQAHNPTAGACWIAGFSFGAWIGMQLLMRRPEIDAFVSVAPPANIYDFGFLAPCPSSGLIVQGTADRIVPLEPVQKLVHKLSHQKGIKIDYRLIEDADHFFSNHIDELSRHVEDYLDKNYKPSTKPKRPSTKSLELAQKLAQPPKPPVISAKTHALTPRTEGLSTRPEPAGKSVSPRSRPVAGKTVSPKSKSVSPKSKPVSPKSKAVSPKSQRPKTVSPRSRPVSGRTVSPRSRTLKGRTRG